MTSRLLLLLFFGVFVACTPASVAPQTFDGDPEKWSAERLHDEGRQRILARDGKGAVDLLRLAEKKAPRNADILGNLATAQMQCGDFDAAIVTLQRAIAIRPQDVVLLANLAQALLITGRTAASEKVLRDAVALSPRDPDLHAALAVTLIAAGKLDDAETAARESIRLDAAEPLYSVNLGYILYRLERLPEAFEILSSVLKAAPDYDDAWNQLGVVQQAMGRTGDAIASFEKALLLNPHHRGARENLDALEGRPAEPPSISSEP